MHLHQKNVDLNETKLFDQYQNLCKFVEKQLETKSTLHREMMAPEIWTEYFETCNTIEFFSEL